MSLSTEDIENAAQSVLTQLSERLFSLNQQKKDATIECMQFGICNVNTPQPHSKREITLSR